VSEHYSISLIQRYRCILKLKESRRRLCDFDAIPVALCKLINHSSEPVQYYAITALTNISCDEYGRIVLAKLHDQLIKKLLVECKLKSLQGIAYETAYLFIVTGQSILCLRNLASDEFFQAQIVQKGK
jgi:vacuolar protein 8